MFLPKFPVLIKIIFSVAISSVCASCQSDPPNSQRFSFQYQNLQYSGLVEYPDSTPTALVILIPGHGKTSLVNGDQLRNERKLFINSGLTVVVWDRAGCGDSEGKYDHEQSVQSSAEEAKVALATIRKMKIAGSQNIGFWGLSRGGWIVPLTIHGGEDIAFWISVGGTDQYETFPYLLQRNFRLQGNSEAETRQLMKEWHFAIRAFHGAVDYDAFLAGTQMLEKNAFLKKMNFGTPSAREFEEIQEHYKTRADYYDEASGREIVVPQFATVLSELDIPVLALFGELDSQVDWRGAKALYETSIGKNARAELTVKVLPNCNHAMYKSETGALFEDLSKFNWQPCEGYLATMETWLIENAFAKSADTHGDQQDPHDTRIAE